MDDFGDFMETPPSPSKPSAMMMTSSQISKAPSGFENDYFGLPDNTFAASSPSSAEKSAPTMDNGWGAFNASSTGALGGKRARISFDFVGAPRSQVRIGTFGRNLYMKIAKRSVEYAHANYLIGIVCSQRRRS
jgi:hypothetical protein